MSRIPARARVADIHDVALSMPGAVLYPGSEDNPIYQVGGKSFVFCQSSLQR